MKSSTRPAYSETHALMRMPTYWAPTSSWVVRSGFTARNGLTAPMVAISAENSSQ